MIGNRILGFQIIEFVEMVVENRLEYVTIEICVDFTSTLPGVKARI